MEAGRASYLCGIVLGCALGFAAAHLAFSSRGVEPALAAPSLELPPAPQDLFPVSGGLTLPPESNTNRHTIVALAEAPAEDSAIEPPKELPNSDDAAPLAVRAAKEDGILREMIRQELDAFAASDRDVWYEALRDLPPSDAKSILQIWKTMRPVRPSSQESLAGPTHVAPKSTVPAPVEAPRTAPSVTVPADESLANYHAYNLLNIDTPGFKRWEPIIVEGNGPFSPNANGRIAESSPQQVAMRLDMTQGELRHTDRPFDLAIEGDGLFTMTLEGQPCYSRCGRLSLDPDRRLGLRTADQRFALLEPQITLPPDCCRLEVRGDGAVLGHRAGEVEPAQLGSILLSLFLDPTALKPIGNGLYASTSESGDSWHAGRDNLHGEILQGRYERSNVRRAGDSLSIEASRHAEHRPAAAPSATH